MHAPCPALPGLRRAEAHGWAPDRIGTYLAAAPGVRGSWTAADVAALAASSP